MLKRRPVVIFLSFFRMSSISSPSRGMCIKSKALRHTRGQEKKRGRETRKKRRHRIEGCASDRMRKKTEALQSSTSSTTLSSGRVGRSRSHVLNSTDSHTGTGQTSECGLSTRAGLLGSGTAGCSELRREGRKGKGQS